MRCACGEHDINTKRDGSASSTRLYAGRVRVHRLSYCDDMAVVVTSSNTAGGWIPSGEHPESATAEKE